MEVCLYNDFAFKWLFGREQKPKPIVSLLNAVVGYDNDKRLFSDVRILTPFDAAKFSTEKQGILDLRVKDETSGIWVDVEIQVSHQAWYPERAMYYLAGMYREELNAGEEYQDLTPCYGVHFLLSDLFPDEAGWLNHYKMLNIKNYKVLSEQWQLYFVELEKFDRAKKESKSSWRLLEQWCDFILRPRDPQKPLDKHLQNNPAIEEVYEMLQEFIQDEKLRGQYRARQEWLRDQRSIERDRREQQEAFEKQKADMQKQKADMQKQKADMQKQKADMQKQKADMQKQKEALLKEKRIKEETQLRSVLGFKKLGQSDKEIAEILGISEKEIKKILKKYNG